MSLSETVKSKLSGLKEKGKEYIERKKRESSERKRVYNEAYGKAEVGAIRARAKADARRKYKRSGRRSGFSIDNVRRSTERTLGNMMSPVRPGENPFAPRPMRSRDPRKKKKKGSKKRIKRVIEYY